MASSDSKDDLANPMTRRDVTRDSEGRNRRTVTSFGDLDDAEAEYRKVMKQLNAPVNKDPTQISQLKSKIRLQPSKRRARSFFPEQFA